MAATMALPIMGAEVQAQDTASPNSSDSASSSAFDGLLGRKNPNTIQLGGIFGEETLAVVGRARAFGYVGPVVVNGTGVTSYGQFFRSQDGKFTQGSVDVSGSAMVDRYRIGEEAPATAVFNDKVLALGPYLGVSSVGGDGNLQHQNIGVAGAEGLFMNGRFQANVKGGAIFYGSLDAKQGLTGDAHGGFVNASASVDLVDIVDLPMGGHLVAIPRTSWSNVDRSLDVNVQGRNVKLGSDATTFGSGLTLVGDFGRWYAGVAGQASTTNVRSTSSFGPSDNNSFTGWGVGAVGGYRISNQLMLDLSGGYEQKDKIGGVVGGVALRYILRSSKTD